MMFLSIRSMIGALLTFSSVFKMVVKERASGMYHLSAFFFARMASDLPVDSTLPTIFILIIYFMAGLRWVISCAMGFRGIKGFPLPGWRPTFFLVECTLPTIVVLITYFMAGLRWVQTLCRS